MSAEIPLAWSGIDNPSHLNVIVSRDNGRTFGGKATFSDTSDTSPDLAFHNGRLFIAWKGLGNNFLNVAKVNTADDKIEDKVTLSDTTHGNPAL